MPSTGRGQAVINTSLHYATPILEFAESALELAPLPGLPLIAKGLSIVVERVKGARANDEIRQAFVRKAQELGDALKEMIDKALKTTQGLSEEAVKQKLAEGFVRSRDLQERIQALLSTVTELREHTKELKGGSGVRGALKGFLYTKHNETILAEMQGSLALAIEMFKIHGQVSIEAVLDDVMREAKDIRKALMAAEEQKILNSLSPAPAGYRSVSELKSEFMDGTRKALFRELKLWSVGRVPEGQPKRFYFLSGGAGLGKSSVSHQFCTRLDTPENTLLGASFFFVRGRSELESARRFFPTLAHQLAMSRPKLRPSILEAIRQYSTRGDDQQMQYAFDELLRAPLLSISHTSQEPFILVIDGLDECQDRTLTPKLLQDLLELACCLDWVRIFVAARPEPYIMSTLVRHEAVYHRDLNDTIDEWAGDVRFYLQVNVPRIAPYGDYIRQYPSALDDLIARAAGLFIYARVAVRFLEVYRDHPEEQFNQLLSPRGTSVSPLDALYQQIFELAFPPGTIPYESARHKRLRSFLEIIALKIAWYSLSARSIAFLSPHLLEADVLEILDRMRSILRTNHTGDIFPIHATVLEFLLDSQRCTNPLYHVDPPKGHARIISGIFTVFTFHACTNILRSGDPAGLNALSYIAACWSIHLGDAAYDEELEQQLRVFLKSQQTVLIRIRDYSRTVPYRRHLLGHADDIQRFMKTSIASDADVLHIGYITVQLYGDLWWFRYPSDESWTDAYSPLELTSWILRNASLYLSLLQGVPPDDTHIFHECFMHHPTWNLQQCHHIYREIAIRIEQGNARQLYFDDLRRLHCHE